MCGWGVEVEKVGGLWICRQYRVIDPAQPDDGSSSSRTARVGAHCVADCLDAASLATLQVAEYDSGKKGE